MTANATLLKSERYENSETIEVHEVNKERIREVWKKLWSSIWVAARDVVDVLWSSLNSHLVLTTEEGKSVRAFNPREELLKKTMIL